MKNRPEPKGDNDDFNLLPPPSLPPPPSLGSQPPRPPLGPLPAPPFFPPPSERFVEHFQQSSAQTRPPSLLKPKGFIVIPPETSAPPLSPSDYFLLGPSAGSVSPAPGPLMPTISTLAFTPLNNLYGSQTQTLTREKEKTKNTVQKELDDKIYEMSNDPPKHQLRHGLANILEPEEEEF